MYVIGFIICHQITSGTIKWNNIYSISVNYLLDSASVLLNKIFDKLLNKAYLNCFKFMLIFAFFE